MFYKFYMHFLVIVQRFEHFYVIALYKLKYYYYYYYDCNILQNDLDTLSQWTNEWLLSFNVDKCKVMHIGKNNPKLEYTMRTENENKILIETREEKDLGVWITNDLKPEKQVIAASQRAMTVLR